MRGVKFVEGPLDRPDTISAGLSYEAKVGGKRVAVGDVPDFGERRSFPDPTGRAGMERHHVTEIEAPEFTVRIPADALSEAQLAELSVDLFRWRGKGPGDHISVTALSKQPKVAVTRIARLDGLREADLPAPVRRQLREAFKRPPDRPLLADAPCPSSCSTNARSGTRISVQTLPSRGRGARTLKWGECPRRPAPPRPRPRTGARRGRDGTPGTRPARAPAPSWSPWCSRTAGP
ncbi:hypothetical protein NKG05_30085 [Oerskovia sp. M15]